jgi:hypothetical protein
MAKKLKRVKAKALFEGALPDKIPVIDKQCDRLLEAREESGKARLREKEIQNKLIELFHSEEPPLTQYVHEASGKVFKIDAPEKVTFKAAPKPKSDNGNNSDEDEETGVEENVENEKEEKLVEA